MKAAGFTICGRLAQCWLFVYRTPVTEIRELLPPALEPVVLGGYAFWNVVVCRLEAMRPPLVPGCLGLGYWHVAYRLHVQARQPNGALLEGLYFVRSDCDRTLMKLAGNWLTDFRFHLAAVRLVEDGSCVRGSILSPAAAAAFEIDRERKVGLASGSPFASLEVAARALEYRPAALSPLGKRMLRVVSVRRDPAAWRWRLVSVRSARWQFFESREISLELCYEVAPVDYRWERARFVEVEPCTS